MTAHHSALTILSNCKEVKRTKIGFKLLLVCVLLASTIGVVVASYVMTSNSVVVTVTAAETLNLGSSSTDIREGESITLTATVSDQRNGIVISFYDDFNSQHNLIGQATTAGGGIATLVTTPTGAGQHSYSAVGLHP
jgi:hypothetical protein